MSKKNSTKGSVSTGNSGFGAQKTPCNVTRKQFAEQARTTAIKVGDTTIDADPRTFASGSLGWYVNGKAKIALADGTIVTVQVGANLTVVNSKELPKEEAA